MIKNVNFFSWACLSVNCIILSMWEDWKGHATDLWHAGIGIKKEKSKLQKREKQKAKYKSLILLIMILQQNNKSLSSTVS